ncbi:MAG TPA: hypothetical protein VFT12_04500 [Thermoanaerobaculia bacterium]|nr:hypothetical protein [Thermoanaerobaculia bacterium]
MRVVRDRPEARWLPSRFRFAAFKLAAWMLYRAAPRRRQPGLVVAIDRDQTAVESYSMAIVIVTAGTLFAFDPLQRYLAWPLAATIAFISVVIFLHVIITFPPIGAWQNSHIELKSFVTIFFLAAAAIHFATADGWIRYVAWLILAAMSLNAAAAIVVRLAKSRMPAGDGEEINP